MYFQCHPRSHASLMRKARKSLKWQVPSARVTSSFSAVKCVAVSIMGKRDAGGSWVPADSWPTQPVNLSVGCHIAANQYRQWSLIKGLFSLLQAVRRPRSPGGAMATSSSALATPPWRRVPQWWWINCSSAPRRGITMGHASSVGRRARGCWSPSPKMSLCRCTVSEHFHCHCCSWHLAWHITLFSFCSQWNPSEWRLSRPTICSRQGIPWPYAASHGARIRRPRSPGCWTGSPFAMLRSLCTVTKR